MKGGVGVTGPQAFGALQDLPGDILDRVVTQQLLFLVTVGFAPRRAGRARALPGIVPGTTRSLDPEPLIVMLERSEEGEVRAVPGGGGRGQEGGQ